MKAEKTPSGSRIHKRYILLSQGWTDSVVRVIFISQECTKSEFALKYEKVLELVNDFLRIPYCKKILFPSNFVLGESFFVS